MTRCRGGGCQTQPVLYYLEFLELWPPTHIDDRDLFRHGGRNSWLETENTLEGARRPRITAWERNLIYAQDGNILPLFHSNNDPSLLWHYKRSLLFYTLNNNIWKKQRIKTFHIPLPSESQTAFEAYGDIYLCVCFPFRLSVDTANTHHQARGECGANGSEGLKVEAKQSSKNSYP